MKKPLIVTLASWKGGTGKSTLTTAVVSVLSLLFKILIIDLDSNLSITRVMGQEDSDISSINLLDGEPVIPVSVTGNIDIIPSDLKISQKQGIADRVLKVRLENFDLSKYDYVFIDPPGTMDTLTRNAIVACDRLIIPGMPSDIDFKAINLVFDEIMLMGAEPDVSVVLNGWDKKRNLNDILEKYQSLEEFFIPEPVGAMKSLKTLTDNFHDYRLSGQAKSAIERFADKVVCCE